MKIKGWLGTLLTGTLGSILASIIIALSPFVIAKIYTFYQDDPQMALLVALTILVIINSLVIFYLFRRQIFLQNALRDQILLQDETKAPGNPEALQATSSVNTDLNLRDVFRITKKEFVENSTPQKLVIEYTNRGNNVIHIKEVRFSTTRELSDSDISSSYLVGKKGRFIIPVDQTQAVMLPGSKYNVEIELAKKWKNEDINSLSGDWGYMDIDLVYKDELMDDFQPI